MGISTTGPVRPADHSLGGNTKGFSLRYASKDIFFTVTEPDYGLPKATLVYFHAPNEFSELMGDQIEKWRDQGYRVVTFDMPGTGLSSRDAQVGKEKLLHMDSLDDGAKAAQEVALYIRNKYEATQNGPLHFVSSSAGFLTAVKTMAELPAGMVGSITAVSPTLDIDLDVFGRDERINAAIEKHPADVDADMKGKFDRLTGKYLQAERTAFFGDKLHLNRDAGSWTKGYFNTLAREVVKADSTEEYADVIKRNGVKVAFIGDPTRDDLADVFDNDYPRDWAKHHKIDVKMTDMPGSGVDLIHNPDRMEEVTQAIESNIARSSSYVAIANQLKSVFRVEWNSVPIQMREAMQRKLVQEGYKLDPSKVDGTPRYGGVSYTERAIAQYLLDHHYDTTKLKRSDFEPQRIMEMIRDPATITGATIDKAATVTGPATLKM